jgi:hypothetical protein
MIIFSGIVFFIAVAWFITILFRSENQLRNIFWPALIVKCIAGICVGLVYTYYYRQGDTLEFFSNGVRLAELTRTHLSSYVNFLFTSTFLTDEVVLLTFGDQRAVFMVKIVSLLSLVSFHNYWVITFYLSLISFLGAWYLVKQIHANFEGAVPAAVVAFLFFPSITFWSAGLIKETVAMAGLYFVCGLVIRIWFRQRITFVAVLAGILFAYLLWQLKYYFAGIFLAVVAASLMYRIASFKFRILVEGYWGLVGWFVFLIVFIGGVTLLHPNFQSHRLMVVMVQNYQAFHEFSDPDGVIVFHDLQPTLSSMLINSPKALVSGLFRPFIWEASNVFSIVIGFENLLLMILTIISLRYVSSIFKSSVRVLLVAIVVYVILLAIFITLSTPNFGTLARYRVGYLPFFVFLILLAPPLTTRLQQAFDKITNVN